MRLLEDTAQKIKLSIKDFLSQCAQIRRKLRILSHLLKKSLTENFIFCAVGNKVHQNIRIHQKPFPFRNLKAKLKISIITESVLINHDHFAAKDEVKLQVPLNSQRQTLISNYDLACSKLILVVLCAEVPHR